MECLIVFALAWISGFLVGWGIGIRRAVVKGPGIVEALRAQFGDESGPTKRVP